MLVKYISDVVHAGTLAVSLQLYSAGKASECSSGGASPITVTQLASWKILTPSFFHLLGNHLHPAFTWSSFHMSDCGLYMGGAGFARRKGSRFNCLMFICPFLVR